MLRPLCSQNKKLESIVEIRRSARPGAPPNRSVLTLIKQVRKSLIINSELKPVSVLHYGEAVLAYREGEIERSLIPIVEKT